MIRYTFLVFICFLAAQGGFAQSLPESNYQLFKMGLLTHENVIVGPEYDVYSREGIDDVFGRYGPYHAGFVTKYEETIPDYFTVSSAGRVIVDNQASEGDYFIALPAMMSKRQLSPSVTSNIGSKFHPMNQKGERRRLFERSLENLLTCELIAEDVVAKEFTDTLMNKIFSTGTDKVKLDDVFNVSGQAIDIMEQAKKLVKLTEHTSVTSKILKVGGKVKKFGFVSKGLSLGGKIPTEKIGKVLGVIGRGKYISKTFMEVLIRSLIIGDGLERKIRALEKYIIAEDGFSGTLSSTSQDGWNKKNVLVNDDAFREAWINVKDGYIKEIEAMEDGLLIKLAKDASIEVLKEVIFQEGSTYIKGAINKLLPGLGHALGYALSSYWRDIHEPIARNAIETGMITLDYGLFHNSTISVRTVDGRSILLKLELQNFLESASSIPTSENDDGLLDVLEMRAYCSYFYNTVGQERLWHEPSSLAGRFGDFLADEIIGDEAIAFRNDKLKILSSDMNVTAQYSKLIYEYFRDGTVFSGRYVEALTRAHTQSLMFFTDLPKDKAYNKAIISMDQFAIMDSEVITDNTGSQNVKKRFRPHEFITKREAIKAIVKTGILLGSYFADDYQNYRVLENDFSNVNLGPDNYPEDYINFNYLKGKYLAISTTSHLTGPLTVFSEDVGPNSMMKSFDFEHLLEVLFGRYEDPFEYPYMHRKAVAIMLDQIITKGLN